MINNRISRRNFVRSFVISSLGVAFYNKTSVSAQSSSIDIEGLANQYLNTLSQGQSMQFITSYQKMSFDQMEEFNEVLTKLAAERLQGVEPGIEERIAVARDMRSEVNKKSIELYGVPFNQLSGSDLSNVIDIIWSSGYSQKMKEVEAQYTTASSCFCFNYSFVTTPGGAGLTSNNQGRQRAANQGECGDCDLEVLFPVNTSIVRFISGVGGIYYANVGGQLGSEFLAQIAYRMD